MRIMKQTQTMMIRNNNVVIILKMLYNYILYNINSFNKNNNLFNNIDIW